jgi:hypothetical protein
MKDYPGGPVVRWVDNRMNEVDPPADADDWARIIREEVGKKVGAGIRVDFVSLRSGRWSIAAADVVRMHTGAGPYSSPTDIRAEVVAALTKAGKPVDK